MSEPVAAPAPAPQASESVSTSDTQNFAVDGNNDTKNVAPAVPERRKVVLDGEELELPLDDIVKGYQKAQVSSKRFEEAARMRKEAEQLKEGLAAVLRSENPEETAEFLSKAFGVDFRKMAEDYLLAKMEEEETEKKLTPEQKRIRELEREHARRQQEDQQRQQTEAQQKHEEETLRYYEEYTKGVTNELKRLNLPMTTTMVKRAGDAMAAHLAVLGPNEDIDMAEAVESARDGFRSEFQEYLSAMDGKALLEEIGTDLLQKIRKADVAAVRSANPAQTPRNPQPERPGQTPRGDRLERLLRSVD